MDDPDLNHALYKQILDNSSEVHFLLDLLEGGGGRIRYLSPAAGRRYGYTLERAQALSDQLVAGLAQRLERFAAGERSRLRVRRELEVPHADGHMIPVEIESTLVLNEIGTAVALSGSVRDVSERQEWERQQKKFASMLSHEFRTPLSTIDGAIQRLEMTGAHHDEATRKRYTKIQNAVDRLLAMLDEYLSPERMASIGRRRQPNEVSPLALLDNAAEQARPRRAAVRVVAEGLPQWVRCDPAGLRLVLDILLDNAIKYTDDSDEITLVGKKATEGGIELSVSDPGAGIPADEVGKLFDRGFRGRAAGGIPGSGLGLYMARAVVEVHGGTLTVENFAESGKKFRIWLPVPA
ncbi:PAS domain-containing sensor histidine kinase [Massilia sp. Root418]|jgi:PAS domain S-box-containing protein|uniref:PAS domain-containing sensor histidine kinase n=1 Tax=Massilia sp. Root418 TaxID=1736532 RepID=UPI0006F71817|nr:PAS domain-containing sensor histidine kinase [Massilia sp. Root418]KQW89879.1 PAS domain-containing sensor histidine kinase [Massilia sp. Root418]